MKILLLAGGVSGEHDVSMRSGDNIEKALIKLGHQVVRADPSAAGFSLEQLAKNADVVFPILHGEGGEDGVLQKQLEALGIPFLGSDAKASEIAFDKQRFKEIMNHYDVTTPKGEVVMADTIIHSALVKKPFVLKPVDGGSSIDTFIIRQLPADLSQFALSFEKYGEMLIEELIEGEEITVGVLGEKALPIILITPPEGEEFDYENKYNGKSQEQIVTNQLAGDLLKRAQDIALEVHNAVGCRHLSRTDIIVTDDGELYVLEINTIPGLTTESLLPKAAAAKGLSFSDLVAEFVRLVQLHLI